MTTLHVPSVLLDTPDGERHRLHAGELIGRGVRCALSFTDPRISEAHAMLSLRNGGFWLLGLRGTVWNGRRWGPEVEVTPHQELRLADGVTLRVHEVDLPTTLLALEGIGDDPLILTHDTLSLRASPFAMRAGFDGDADAWIWSSEGHWLLRDASGDIRVLEIGLPIQLGANRLTVVGVPLQAGQAGQTIRQRAAHPPLDIEVGMQQTSVRCGSRSVVLIGRSHDIFRLTAVLTRDKGEPVHWSDIAGRIWRVNATPDNWYHNRARLGTKLKNAGMPGDLVQMDRGLVSLALRPGVDTLTIHEGEAP